MCQAVAQSSQPARLPLPIFKMFHCVATQIAAVDFPWQTEVGAGLALTHGWGLLVNRGVKLGTNVTLFHGVTLGQRDQISNDGTRTSGYPVLEDEVWIGPHAIVVGAVTIGRGRRVAGGAFVRESIPPFSIVAGNPGRIVKKNCMLDVANAAQI